MRLYNLLNPHIEKHKLGELFVAPQDVVLEEHTVIQPDLFFIARNRLRIVTEKNIQGAPDLVIEIESDRDEWADWVKRLGACSRYGVSEVWHVRPNPRTVDVYRRSKNKLDHVERLDAEGKLRSPFLPRLSASLRKIWV